MWRHPGVERGDSEVVVEPKRMVGLPCAEAQDRCVRARERQLGGGRAGTKRAVRERAGHCFTVLGRDGCGRLRDAGGGVAARVVAEETGEGARLSRASTPLAELIRARLQRDGVLGRGPTELE